MVELKNVSVTYSSGVDALNNVSLKINDGDFAFVVGSSGAGKSTMIKLLLKEIDATSGVVTVNGYNLNKLKKRKIPEFRRTLGFVFQDFRLIPSMTVYENIAFVLRVIDAPIKYIRKRVPYVISLVGLHAKTNSYPDELSGGEKQRVAIARALVNDPQLIIADEPTGNIDPELSYEIVELLKGINDQGTTILMVTHEHDLVRHFGGRIINITEGEIVFDEVITGTGDELVADIDSEITPEAMAAAISEAEAAEDTESQDTVNTEEAIELPIENMTADDIISAIGGIPDAAEKAEKEFMMPVKENIDVDIAPKPKSDEPTPQELLAALTEKTEGGAE
ncbi:MAG: cell division ATP-binding protein FtsE [Ruminococcus sp.]|nr:cell division ATP-binding protein FtsE [Ruminococcus sp.]